MRRLAGAPASPRLAPAALAWAVLLIAAPAAAQPAALAHVPDTAALGRVASTTHRTVVRDGFARPGDAPALSYISSSSPCPLNAGAGDGGSQVRSSDGGCWLWNPPTAGVAPLEFGARGDGAADDTAALQAALDAAAAAGVPLRFDRNHLYRVGSTLEIASPIDIEGEEPHGLWLSTPVSAAPFRQCRSGITAVQGERPASFTILDVSAVSGVIRGLCVQAGPTGSTAGVNATAGAAMRFAPPDARHHMTGWIIEYNAIYNPYDGMTFDGAGPSSQCCGAGATADGVLVRENAIVSPAHIGISVGRNTVGSETAGLTFFDNILGCISDQSRARGVGFALFDGGIDYDGTNNGPEMCDIGFEIAPGYVEGAGAQVAQAVLRGVLGDQSATHDLLIQPTGDGAHGGVVEYVQADGVWAAATGDVNSVLVDCNVAGASCYQLTFSDMEVHGGAGQDRPIVDIESGAGSLFDLTITGSSIDPFGRAAAKAVGLRLGCNSASIPCGRWTIVGNRIGTGNGSLPTGIELSIAPGAEGNIQILGNDLSGVFDTGGAPVAYTPNVTDRVSFANNMGVDGGGVSPRYAAAATVSLRNADQDIAIVGDGVIANLAHPWQGRRVDALAISGFSWTTGGSPGFCAPGSAAAGHEVTFVWRAGARCWSVHAG